MHYYQFNIGDYHSHTGHLDPLEDIAYRRMIDWCYLHEDHLPDDIEQIARLIRMRTHCERIANVLREFFELRDGGYFCLRIEREIQAYWDKKDKARQSAKARWLKEKKKSNNANAIRPHSERNANHKPITNNQEPIKTPLPPLLNSESWNDYLEYRKTAKKGSLKPKSEERLILWLIEQGNSGTQKQIIDQTIRNGWTGLFELKGNGNGNQQAESKAKRHSDKLREIAERAARKGDAI